VDPAPSGPPLPLPVVVQVLGAPVAKQRPRFATTTPRGRPLRRPVVYTPAETRAWEEDVGWQVKACTGNHTPPEGPLDVCLVFWLPPPVLYRRGEADADNLAKAVLDAGNGRLWRDDAQLARLAVEKRPAPTASRAGVTVAVAAWEAAGAPQPWPATPAPPPAGRRSLAAP
jgi:Holliday junction resolvase RusA-like endonuclease